MKKSLNFFILISLAIALYAYAADGGKKVAKIKLKRGKAHIILPSGKSIAAQAGKWITQGSIIKTKARSFVRLSFIDKSSVNIGPNSEMKVEKFSKNEAGVLNLISGKIRSKVSKDYLQMKKDKSKLFVKSKSAVMGIRGTDFVYSYNKKTDASTAVLFEGSVVFNKINAKTQKMQLEDIVNRGHRINPGQFSVSRKGMNSPTIPAKMSSRQMRALHKNDTFIQKAPMKKVAIKKSIVPPGLSGDVVLSSSKSLEEGINKVVNANVKSRNKKIDKNKMKETKGFVNGDSVKPVDGSIVHIDSGTIIPLGFDSTFDPNQSEWVSSSVGGVDDSGNYIPPEGFKMTEEGKLLKVVEGSPVKEVVLEIKPLDEVRPLDQLETVDYRPVINESVEGPAPAGEAENPKNLPPPPICDGCTYQPPSFNKNDPSGGSGKIIRPKTDMTINIKKGN